MADNSIAEALRTAYEAKALAEDAETKFNNWADDDVISPTEISDIRSEKEFVLSDYSEIYTNAHTFGVDTAVSTSAHVTELTSAYTAYLTDLNAVITAYNNRTNPTDCVTIPTGMGTHMSAYYTKREVVLTDIATAASTGISSAAAAASNAQTTANNVTTYVGQSLADGVLTKDEIEVLQTYKKSLSDQYNALVASYTDLIDQAYNVLQDPGLSHTSSVYTALSNAYAALTTTTTGTYALLDTAHTALVNAVNAILTRGATAVGSTDSALPALKTAFDTAASTFSTAISNYIEDVQELQNAVENAMKYITIAGYQYLTEAIVNGETTIAGGLVATNTIVLGNTPQSSGYKVTAGINGITTIEGVEDTSAIAAWYGGPFRDKTYYYD